MSWTKTRGEIALWVKLHPGQPVPVEMYAHLKAERFVDQIQKLADSAPPLSAEQRATIAAALADFSTPTRDADVSS